MDGYRWVAWGQGPEGHLWFDVGLLPTDTSELEPLRGEEGLIIHAGDYLLTTGSVVHAPSLDIAHTLTADEKAGVDAGRFGWLGRSWFWFGTTDGSVLIDVAENGESFRYPGLAPVQFSADRNWLVLESTADDGTVWTARSDALDDPERLAEGSFVGEIT